jgi:hypothetical protein
MLKSSWLLDTTEDVGITVRRAARDSAVRVGVENVIQPVVVLPLHGRSFTGPYCLYSS